MVKNFDRTDGKVLPIGVYFDDLETGDAMGSHAGKCEIGVVDVFILCEPPSEASKLDSIMFTSSFMSKHRKLYGNKKVFAPLIKDLKSLCTEGVLINVDNVSDKVYFLTVIITGDNLGLNGILGMVESFGLTHCCRICYVGPKDFPFMTKEDPALLRTIEQYLIDSQNPQVSITGIKEECTFNEVENYNLIANASVDIMHDAAEGFANVVVTKLILKYEKEGFITIDEFNENMQSIDFGAESSNVPMNIDLNYLKKNGKLKTSASETFFLVRFLGVIIGHKVPRHEKTWLLWIKLRKIIKIITAPAISETDQVLLSTIVTEHHKLYVQEFGEMTPKFHNVLHYAGQIKKLGPLAKFSAMRCESFHVLIKLILSAVASKRCILKTIGIRYELSMMHSIKKKHESKYISYGRAESKNVYVQYPTDTRAIFYSSITINDVQYKSDVVIQIPGDDFTNFGIIRKVYVAENQICFEYTPLESIGFNQHYFAHNVIEHSSSLEYINYSSLDKRYPCVYFTRNKFKYVATREDSIIFL